ncbi:uncharacterized protein LOC132033000 [Lycium ferocissimum]|uniref:uncharacterized protein LOC132033000 n=1 Tax=Lycium ferocissimum TaxID=112874 RepID=UPI0028156620|nr:uncharacterized protein LOC132033000 [Lycium ferocissimum]
MAKRGRGRPRKDEPAAIATKDTPLQTIQALISGGKEQSMNKGTITPNREATLKSTGKTSGIPKLTPPDMAATPTSTASKNPILGSAIAMEKPRETRSIGGVTPMQLMAVKETREEQKPAQQPEEGNMRQTRTWTSLFANNRNAANGMPLSFIPPIIVDGEPMVVIESSETAAQTKEWSNALILYVMGETPSFSFMKKYIAKNWTGVAEPRVYWHEEGYYIVKFRCIEDRDEILYSGPYTLNSRPLILTPWTPNFDFQQDFPRTMPLWVRFPNLPLNHWGPGPLSKIASRLGEPMFADECTKKQTYLSFARVLVDVDITQDLPREIVVTDENGQTFTQGVEFDWKPLFCKYCIQHGHECKEDPKQPTNQKKGNRMQHPQKGEKRGYKGYEKPVQQWVGKPGPVQLPGVVIKPVNVQQDTQRVEATEGKDKQKVITQPEGNKEEWPALPTIYVTPLPGGSSGASSSHVDSMGSMSFGAAHKGESSPLVTGAMVTVKLGLPPEGGEPPTCQ